MAPLMVGATPPEEQVPQPREIDRGPAPARGDSGIVDGAPTWSPLEADEGDELVAPEDDGAFDEDAASGFGGDDVDADAVEELHDLAPVHQPAAAGSAAATSAAVLIPLAAITGPPVPPSPSPPRFPPKRGSRS